MVPTLIRMSPVWRKIASGETRLISRAGYIFAVFIILSTALTGLGDLISTELIHWALLSVNGTFISVFLATQRKPDFNRLIKIETRKAQYEKTKLKGLEVDNIIIRLNELMEDEKVFAVEGLTLAHLADELDISPHQLSEILNEKLNKNFNSYINEHRINESKKLLIDEPGRSITSISSAVGFTSNTTYSTVFTKNTGCSPREYRHKKQSK